MAGHNGSNGANGETGEPIGRHPRGEGEQSEGAVIGKPFVKVDARAKVTGMMKFADDLTLPRMIHAKILRSTEAHARIVKIDATRALELDGVFAVLTGKDLPTPYGILPVSQDEHALCIERVRFIGDPVAAVAAVDEETAEAACRLIDVVYEPLETIDSVAKALKTPEPRIHDYGEEGNIHKRVNLEFGDVEAGFAESDYVRDDLFFFEGNTHLPLEQHASLAEWHPDGKITLWSSTQTPHYVHRALAKVLDMPSSRVRIVAIPNGGGFGGKSDIFNHEIVVAALARQTGRPVKICLTREEVFYCHRGRHPVLMRFKTGVDKNGRIKAMHSETYIDGGAYGSYGVASTFYTGALQTVTYNIERYKFDSVRCFTNKAPCGPKRGHGTPQPRFGLEVQIDKIAEALGIDPIKIRQDNLVEAHSMTANWLKVGSMGLGACLEKVAAGSNWAERHGKLPYGKGIGVACGSYLSGAGLPIYWNDMPHSGVQIKLDRSGGVAVFCGATDIGQGSDSVLAFVVAEILGIDPVDIRVVTGDTDLTPVDLGSYSSRVTLMMGNAAIEAAERARAPLAEAVAAKLDVPRSRLVFGGGRVFDAGNPDAGVTFAQAVQLAETKIGTIGSTGSYKPPRSPGKYKGAGVGPSPAYSYSAAVAEVDVDPETGIVAVSRIHIAHDIGRSINPTLVMGQVEGSVYMGLGEALMEAMEYRGNRGVVHKFPSMLEYKSPTTMEMPEVITYLIEDPDPSGPFGAKEVGQGPLLPIMPAVANAVFDAVGVRVDEIPVGPEKVLKAIRAKAEGKEGRFGPSKTPPVEWKEPLRVPPPWEGGDGRSLDDPKHTPATPQADPYGHRYKHDM